MTLQRGALTLVAAGLSALILAWTQNAGAAPANCPAVIADVDRQLAAARKTYNESSSALFACYNTKIQAELRVAGKTYREQSVGISKAQRAALRASHEVKRQSILRQWDDFRIEKNALLNTYKGRSAVLSASRRRASSGQCNDPLGSTPGAAAAARQQQIKDVKAKIAGHDQILKEHAGRRARNLAQLQDIKTRMRALMGQAGFGAAGKEFTRWFAENGRVGADYNEKTMRFSPSLNDASGVLLDSFRTGLTLVTKHSTLPEKKQVVARFNTVASDIRSLDRATVQTIKSRQSLQSQLAQLEKPVAATPVRAGADAFNDPKPASKCRA